MKKVYYIILILALLALSVFLVLQTVEIRQISDDERISQQMESIKTYVTTDSAEREPQTIAPSPPETTAPETILVETTAPETTAPETTAPVTTAPETTAPVTTAPETAAPVTTVPETTAPVTTVPETTVPVTTVPETTVPVITVPETTVSVTTVPQTTAPVTTVPETEAPKQEPVFLDFDAMREINPDIHAWIEIEGTNVDYPVLQSPTDDERYLNHNVEGDVHVCGSLFTQATYNSTDFNDPVTVIYGHTMMSGVFFGQLQDVYSEAESFREHQKIQLYLPGETRTYTVFAAVPYDTQHILHTYGNFEKKYWFNRFIKSIFEIRDMTAQFDEEYTPSYGDPVIILSMCYKQSVTRRYLVLAVLSEASTPTAIQ